MNTRKIDLSSTKRKKLREKQDEIELLYTTYGYFSYKGNLSSRFGGSYGGLGYGVGNGIGGNRLGFGGFERKERRIEYVANQGMHHDLDTCGCENFKLDVIFGYVTAKNFKFSFGKETKELATIFISRRLIPKFTSKELRPGMGFEGIPGNMVEVETLFNDGKKVYTHVILKASLGFQVYNLFELDPMKRFQNTNEFDIGVNQDRIFTAHANYLKKNYGATLVMNMLDLEDEEEKSRLEEIEKTIKRTEIKNIRYKYFNPKQNEESSVVDNLLDLYSGILNLDDNFGFRQFNENGILERDQKGVIRLTCGDLIGLSDTFILLNFYSHLYLLACRGLIELKAFFEQLKSFPNDLTLGTRKIFIDFSEYNARMLQGTSSKVSQGLRKEMPLELNTLREDTHSGVNKNMLKFSSLLHMMTREQTGILTQNISESIHRFAANDESYFRMKKLRVQLVTWNVAGYKPTDFKKVLNLFNNIENDQPEIVVVGLQEIFEMKSKNIKKFIVKSTKESTRWRFMAKQCLNSVGIYNLVEDQAMLGVYCAVFASPEVAAYIKKMEVDTVKLGILNMGNKGGVVMKCKIFETTLKFCVCHLASGQKKQNMKDRYSQIDKIYEAAFEGDSNTYRFWLGDFNFRVNLGYEEVMLALLEYKRMKEAKYFKPAQELLEKLLKHEQMITSMSSHPVLRHFQEAKIRFKPTYKLEDFKDNYKLKKTRVPSWTDRILYCLPKNGYINIVRYDNTETFGSDHRPVYLLADIKIKVINKQKLRSDMVKGMI